MSLIKKILMKKILINKSRIRESLVQKISQIFFLHIYKCQPDTMRKTNKGFEKGS